MPDFNSYLSPFSWRYGSREMRSVWSEANKRRIWRSIWLALAEVEAGYGLVSPGQVEELRRHVETVDVERALEIESEIHHDLMAEIKTYAEQAPLAAGIIHLGATSMDIEDNADALRLRQSLDLLTARLKSLLLAFAGQIERWAETPVIAFTHLQPAEPSTLGYRLAFYAQDLLENWQQLNQTRAEIRGKGFKGAVGTAASYADLIGAGNFAAFEERLSELLELPFFSVASQTYPRQQDYRVVSALAGLGASLYKFAFDLRLLQSPVIGEASEAFGRKQVGSSAMPFKRNPINAEKIDSLARALAQMPVVAWGNAAHSLLERTLDDSANRRTLLPEAFLTCDELLITAEKLVSGLQVNEQAIQRNMEVYAPFAATERLLMALAKAGADRQQMHEVLREHSLAAWEAVQRGQPNPLTAHLAADPAVQIYLTPSQIIDLLSIRDYLGIAPDHAREMAAQIHAAVEAQPLQGAAQQ